VGKHHGNEQHRHDAVDDLGNLHARDVGAIEREHQDVAAHRDRAAAEHNDPVDHLLAGVEAARRRVPAADDAAAGL
jgi:hypothetical protein